MSFIVFFIISLMIIYRFATCLMPLIAVWLNHYHFDASQHRGSHSWKALARIKPWLSLFQTLTTMYANQVNIILVIEIFKSLLTCKQGDLFLQDHSVAFWSCFRRSTFISLQPHTLWCLSVIARSSILASISMGFVPPLHPTLGALFVLVTMYLFSLQFSLLLFGLWLLCLLAFALGDTPPLALMVSTLQACDDSNLSTCSKWSSSYGHDHNSFNHSSLW